MKKLLIVAAVLVSGYALMGWLYACCPGVAACGGCNVMNWERLILLIFIALGLLVIGIICAVIWMVNGLSDGRLKPFQSVDECSTDNPERDYADR